MKNYLGIKVSLNKKIPMQAGMAGGSTDAAAFINAMNKLFDLRMTENEIKSIGREIGADVVPCLYNIPVKAEGIGDIVNKLNTNLKYYIIVIKPDISCDTKYMYQRIDMTKDLKQNDFTEKIIEGMQKNNLKLMTSGMYNVFESVIEQKEKIEDIKNDFIKIGAINSLMTGSGSCVYGIFETKIEAKKAYEILKKKYNEIYICNSFVSEND